MCNPLINHFHSEINFLTLIRKVWSKIENSIFPKQATAIDICNHRVSNSGFIAVACPGKTQLAVLDHTIRINVEITWPLKKNLIQAKN